MPAKKTASDQQQEHLIALVEGKRVGGSLLGSA